MREKLQRFMMGRYGQDQLNKDLLVVVLVLFVINLFIKVQSIHNLVYYAGMILLIICYARLFSRNYSKRYAENQKYLVFRNKVLGRFGRGGSGGYGYNNYTGYNNAAAQDPGYKIFKCPGCKQKIRIPKGKKKIEITCPKCGQKFIRRS